MNGKIDHSLFSAHEHALEHEVCPKCGETHSGELQLKNGKHGAFLGCTRYPECDYLKPLHQNDGHIIKELGVPCPECESELVLRQGRYGMFIGCSNYPHCQHIESTHTISQPQQQDDVACPECKNGTLVERKSRYGKSFYACNAYPSCRFAVNHPPVSGQCEECDFQLLIEKLVAGEKVFHCAERKCNHKQSK